MTSTGRPLVHSLANSELTTALAFLDANYGRYAGAVDRARYPRPARPVDRLGLPFHYFVAEIDGAIAGVAAFTAGGDVAEWAVPAGPEATATARALLETGERWVRELGGREILFYVPPEDDPDGAMLAWLGYRRTESPKTVMQIVHLPVLLQEMARARRSELAPLAPLSMQMHLEAGFYRPPFEPDIVLRLDATGPSVEAGVDAGAAVRIETTMTLLSEFLFVGRDFDSLRQAGLTIEPESAGATVRRVLDALAFRHRWFAPLGERR